MEVLPSLRCKFDRRTPFGCHQTKLYQVWLVCEVAIIYFLYPETKGPTLEEIAHSKKIPARRRVTDVSYGLLTCSPIVFDDPKVKDSEKLNYDEDTKEANVTHIDTKSDVKA